jgi:hypothetical protein
METLKKKTLFWDVSSLDPDANKRFIIDRILQLGNLDDLKWAFGYYGKDELKRTLIKSRSIDAKSLSFWCQYFKIDKNQCLKMQSTKKQGAFSQR